MNCQKNTEPTYHRAFPFFSYYSPKIKTIFVCISSYFVFVFLINLSKISPISISVHTISSSASDSGRRRHAAKKPWNISVLSTPWLTSAMLLLDTTEMMVVIYIRRIGLEHHLCTLYVMALFIQCVPD